MVDFPLAVWAYSWDFMFVECVKAVTLDPCPIEIPSSAQSLWVKGAAAVKAELHLLPAGHEVCSVDSHYCLRWSDAFHSWFTAIYTFCFVFFTQLW